MNSLNATHFHDDAAREYLKAVRSPDARACPHRSVVVDHYRLEGKADRRRAC
jgi:hypothetical protein